MNDIHLYASQTLIKVLSWIFMEVLYSQVSPKSSFGRGQKVKPAIWTTWMRGGGGRGTYDDETCFLKKKRERPGHLAGLGRSGLIAHRAALMGWGGGGSKRAGRSSPCHLDAARDKKMCPIVISKLWLARFTYHEWLGWIFDRQRVEKIHLVGSTCIPRINKHMKNLQENHMYKTFQFWSPNSKCSRVNNNVVILFWIAASFCLPFITSHKFLTLHFSPEYELQDLHARAL